MMPERHRGPGDGEGGSSLRAMPSPTGKPPLVSVITPTYNMGGRLQACLDSVRRQTYLNIEHIVIDGGSTDGTQEVLERSGARWVSEPDRGQSDAINKGLRMASGDILGWLNADDELLPDALKRVAAALSENSAVGIAYGDIEHVEGNVSRRVAPSGPLTSEGLWRGNVISQPGTFWRRWAQEKVGLIDEEFHLTMDYELWLRFAKHQIPAVYVPHVLARFAVHEDSKTGSQDSLAFAEEEARALRKHGEIHGAAMAIDRWYIDAQRRQIEGTVDNDPPRARELAKNALRRMRPVRDRPRMYMWLVRLSPSLARVAPRVRALADASSSRNCNTASLRQAAKRTPLGRAIRALRDRREVAAWRAAGSPAPPPHVLKTLELRRYAKAHSLRILVETGTFRGDMVERQDRYFDRIYTIELDDQLHAAAQVRFADRPHIRLLHGDSATTLPALLTSIDAPALFWLDAHYSGGVTARARSDTPISAEIDVLLDRPQRDVILIDHAWLFDGTDGYPALEELMLEVKRRRPDLHIDCHDDIIRIAP